MSSRPNILDETTTRMTAEEYKKLIERQIEASKYLTCLKKVEETEPELIAVEKRRRAMSMLRDA